MNTAIILDAKELAQAAGALRSNSKMAQLTDDCFAFSGPLLPVDEVAQAAGTIAYELLCAVAARVPFALDETEPAAVAAAA